MEQRHRYVARDGRVFYGDRFTVSELEERDRKERAMRNWLPDLCRVLSRGMTERRTARLHELNERDFEGRPRTIEADVQAEVEARESEADLLRGPDEEDEPAHLLDEGTG